MKRGRYYCHVGYLGIASQGESVSEPSLRSPLVVAGYGDTPEAAYTAARRALVERQRAKEKLTYEARVENSIKTNLLRWGKHRKEGTDGSEKDGRPEVGGGGRGGELDGPGALPGGDEPLGVRDRGPDA